MTKRWIPVFMLLTSYPVIGQWTQLTDFQAEFRDDGVVFQTPMGTWLGTGLSAGFKTLGNFMGFADANMQPFWSPAASLPAGEERQYATGWSYENYGYVFGGVDSNGAFLNDLWRYDPLNNLWDSLPPLPSFGRSGSAAFVLNDRLYLLGGLGPQGYALDEVWTYIPADSIWNRETDLPMGARFRACGINYDEYGFLCFGRDSAGAYHNEFYIFDETNGWNSLPPFPGSGKSHASLVTIGDRLYTFGGSDSLNQFSNELWYYSLPAGQWKYESTLPGMGRRGGFAWSLNNAFYYSCGLMENQQRTRDTWRYIPYFSEPEYPIELISLAPVPTSDKLHFSSLLTADRLEIINTEGQPVMIKTDHETIVPLSVAHLPSGTYVLRITIDDRMRIIRFVKI